jgi:DNA topoisomerase-2
MNMFDLHSVIRKMESPLEILQEFYIVRVRFYEKRKDYLLEKLSDEWSKFDNKCRFIKAVIDGALIISNRKKNDLLSDLKRMGFRSFMPISKVNILPLSQKNPAYFHFSLLIYISQ